MTILHESTNRGVVSAVHPPTSAVLHRSLHDLPLRVVAADGLYLELENGQKIMDATGGAAVSCLGHNSRIIRDAIVEQLDTVAYCHSMFYSTTAAEELCKLLVDGTDGHMVRAFIVSSGSEAAEAAMKMARQYFVELEGKSTQRCKFIARKSSYHGTTLGALGLGGHLARRAIYEPILSSGVSHVSPCYEYRDRKQGESVEAYVDRLALELENEFKRLGPETVCAFVAEPIVGAALGCVPAVQGYFAAIRKVCDKYGVLLIMDEIMSGMGRSGYLHAWQSPVVGTKPDLQTIGKGLGGGYQPIAGLLLSSKVVNVLSNGTGAFSHGQTYQGHPVACAAAAAVQKQIMQPSVMDHVRSMGAVLEASLMKKLSGHPFVGNIRGMGLFWGIELVKNKATKEPFDSKLQIGLALHELAMSEPYSISIYPGTGTADGVRGDHILLAPPYVSTIEDIQLIADKTASVIIDFFDKQQPLQVEVIMKSLTEVKVAEILPEPDQGTLATEV